MDFRANFVEDKAKFRRLANAKSKSRNFNTRCVQLFAQGRRMEAPTAKRITKRSQRQDPPKKRVQYPMNNALTISFYA